MTMITNSWEASRGWDLYDPQCSPTQKRRYTAGDVEYTAWIRDMVDGTPEAPSQLQIKKATPQIKISGNTVVLQPVSMVLPTKRCVRSPSRFDTQVQIPYAEFLRRYADRGRGLWYNSDPDPTHKTINSGAKRVTGYLDIFEWRAGWFVVVE